MPNQDEDRELTIRQRIVNCFNGDDTVPTRAIDNLEALITQKQLEARIDELERHIFGADAGVVQHRIAELTKQEGKGNE